MPNSRSARAHGHRRKDIVAHDAAGDGPGSRGRSEGGSRRGEGKDSEGEFHGAGGSMTKIVSIMRPVTATRPLPHPPLHLSTIGIIGDVVICLGLGA